MRRWTAVLLGSLLVLALTACGDDDGGDGADGTTTEGTADGAGDGTDGEGENGTDGANGEEEEEASGACLFLTAEDVAEVLGDAGEVSRQSGSPLACTYSVGDEGVQASLTVQPDALAETDFDEAVQPLTEFEGAEPTPVEDLGDAAVEISEPLSMVSVASGDDLLSVSVVGQEDPSEAQIELARRVLDHMG
jgi:hypothetical protein